MNAEGRGRRTIRVYLIATSGRYVHYCCRCVPAVRQVWTFASGIKGLYLPSRWNRNSGFVYRCSLIAARSQSHTFLYPTVTKGTLACRHGILPRASKGGTRPLRSSSMAQEVGQLDGGSMLTVIRDMLMSITSWWKTSWNSFDWGTRMETAMVRHAGSTQPMPTPLIPSHFHPSISHFPSIHYSQSKSSSRQSAALHHVCSAAMRMRCLSIMSHSTLARARNAPSLDD